MYLLAGSGSCGLCWNRIDTIRFLAECGKMRLSQSLVLLGLAFLGVSYICLRAPVCKIGLFIFGVILA